jgi:hypothetical protein
MIRRLFTGLVLGLAIGAIAAAVLVKGLGITVTVGFLAYASALATGAVVGLVAGKPIWAKGAWIEGLLKTFFGALLAAGGMFALQKFAGMEVDLTRFDAGSGKIGELAVLALPAIATVLAVFFELDNTGGDEPAEKGARVAGKVPQAKLRAPVSSRAAAVEAEDDGPVASKRAKK